MVGIRSDFRGRGLSRFLCRKGQEHLLPVGLAYLYLATDEWRKPAIRTYLAEGFLPVEYAAGMPERWEGVMKDLNLDTLTMLDEDGHFCRTLTKPV